MQNVSASDLGFWGVGVGWEFSHIIPRFPTLYLKTFVPHAVILTRHCRHLQQNTKILRSSEHLLEQNPSFLSHFLTRRSAMEFWGVEVKGGEPLQCHPGEEYLVHVSQACLGEKKKDKLYEPVYIYAKIGDKKFVIATLSHDKFPQSVLDLVFEKEFELSHTGKNASVHFTGYKVLKQDETDDSELEEDSEEDAAVAADTGKPASQASLAKKADAKEKGKVIDNKYSDDSEESDDDMPLTNGEDEDDESGDEDDTSDEDEEDEDSDEEETPKKVEPAVKKRAADSATKTPAPDKKAKFVSPQKSDGKKVSGHVATPYPTKKSEKKSSISSDQKKDATPKGSVTCTTCSRSFGTDKALESHSKAKHGSA